MSTVETKEIQKKKWKIEPSFIGVMVSGFESIDWVVKYVNGEASS